MNKSTDPHDPSGRLPALEKEFSDRPDYGGWQPGDPMLTTEEIRASQAYAARLFHSKESTATKQRRTELKRKERERRKGRRKRIGVALAGLALGYGIIAPGVGAIDRIGAATSSASERVAEVTSEITVSDIGNIEDGVAAKRVEDVYAMIDAQGMEAVDKLASRYREANREEFEAFFHRDEYIQQFEEANSIVEVEAVLRSFLQFYNVSLQPIDADYDTDDVKNIGEAFVKVLAPLPKSIIQNHSKLRQIEITTQVDDNEAGSMSSRGVMIVRPLGQVNSSLNEYMGKVVSEPASYEHTIAHELIHAIDFKSERSFVRLKEYQYSIVKDTASSYPATRFIDGLVARPETPSSYSLSDKAEFAAEVGAGVLSDGVNDLASPDEWRKFTADSTKYYVEFLVAMERIHPGIAMLLVTDRAML